MIKISVTVGAAVILQRYDVLCVQQLNAQRRVSLMALVEQAEKRKREREQAQKGRFASEQLTLRGDSQLSSGGQGEGLLENVNDQTVASDQMKLGGGSSRLMSGKRVRGAVESSSDNSDDHERRFVYSTNIGKKFEVILLLVVPEIL